MFDIEQLLSMPEGKTLEFKRDLSSIQPVVKTLIAFANTAGGILIIGRDDEGSIVGIKDVFALEEKLSNAIADSIYPPLMPDIEIVSVEGKSLIVVKVAHWWGPFYLKAKGPIEGVYIRLGSTNRIAGQEFLDELQRARSKIFFDQLPCPEIGYEGLDMEKTKKIFANAGREVDQNKLLSLGVLVPYSKKIVCSNGGLILFGHKEARDQYFPNATVRCAKFLGTDKVEFLDHYDVEGSILDAMLEVPKFIRRNTRLSSKIEGIRREDIPEYSPIVIREILTNALVHADYSIRGMNPRITIFSNRMEIESPGMLPFGYTLNDFISGVSHVRNKVIARTFRELRMMEEWGTGYKRIVETCRKEKYPIPKWEELGITLRVTLQPNIVLKTSKQEKLHKLSPRQKTIISLLGEVEKMSSKEISERLTGDFSPRTLRLDLSELKKQHLIDTIGGGPKTYWVLVS